MTEEVICFRGDTVKKEEEGDLFKGIPPELYEEEEEGAECGYHWVDPETFWKNASRAPRETPKMTTLTAYVQALVQLSLGLYPTIRILVL